jgi:mono/diheme cytochrome c family protein
MKLKLFLVVMGTLCLMAIGAGIFVESGVYDIGADDHHTKPVFAVIEQLRNRSIEVRASSVEIHLVADPARLAAGAQHYAVFCAACHLAPGAGKSDLRTGMYPHPPSLAQADVRDLRRVFWVIKHGIKMSAMPAWGKTLDDDAIWELVAFAGKLPDLTPESYRALLSHAG